MAWSEVFSASVARAGRFLARSPRTPFFRRLRGRLRSSRPNSVVWWRRIYALTSPGRRKCLPSGHCTVPLPRRKQRSIILNVSIVVSVPTNKALESLSPVGIDWHSSGYFTTYDDTVLKQWICHRCVVLPNSIDFP